MRSNVVKAFGLGDADLPVLQRAFRPQGARFTEVLAVGIKGFGAERPVFVARVDEEDGSCVVWQTSINGDLQATFTLESGTSSVSKSNEATDFAVAKRYFLDRYKIEGLGAAQRKIQNES